MCVMLLHVRTLFSICISYCLCLRSILTARISSEKKMASSFPSFYYSGMTRGQKHFFSPDFLYVSKTMLNSWLEDKKSLCFLSLRFLSLLPQHSPGKEFFQRTQLFLYISQLVYNLYFGDTERMYGVPGLSSK